MLYAPNHCSSYASFGTLPLWTLRAQFRQCRLISLNSFIGAGERHSSETWNRTMNSNSATRGRHSCQRRALQSKCSARATVPTFAAALDDGDAVWDMLGLGQAMVDFAATVDDEFLLQLGVEKGGRRIITVEERAKILEMLDSGCYQISAGGSLANTLANLGRLGHADKAVSKGLRQPLSVAAASVAGTDALGSFHTAQQSKAGIHTLSQPLPNSCTGTVIVLTTPDANRTFLSYLGTSQQLDLTPEVMTAIRQSRLVALEGYLWETPNAAESIEQVTRLARGSGGVVAMTAGDANVVKRHREEIWKALKSGINILFANRSEAEALLDKQCSAEQAALTLGPHCDMVVVTDGANGSCISAMGRLQVIPPFWATSKPVDTCGAGDAYAAGLIYGWLTGMDPCNMGRCGARVASAVIAKCGGALTDTEAEALVEALSVSSMGPIEFLKAGNFA